MNKFTLGLIACIFAVAAPSGAFAANFTSNGTGGGNWFLASTWTFTGSDPDGIPDYNDNVVVQAGDVVMWNNAAYVNNLTVNGTFQHAGSVKTITVYGNYVLNGTELGSGSFAFTGTGTTISGAGAFAGNSRWAFATNRTIATTTAAAIVKNQQIIIWNGCTVTNMGNLKVYTVVLGDPGATWINGTNSTLILTNGSFMNGGTFNATATGNTVITMFPYLTNLPNAVGYYNLTIGTPGTTQMAANTIVRNTFRLAYNSTFICNHDLSIGRHFEIASANCSFVQNPNTTITFNGTLAQNITVPFNLSFQNLAINNSGPGVTITSPRTFNVLQSLSLVDGNFNISTAAAFNLVSNATQTAVIGPSTANASVTGNINAQRFVSARAAGYSDMAGSMQNQTLADWDDELLLVYTYSPPSAYPSVFGYDETGFDYVPITSATQPLDPGVGFEVYLDSDGGQSTFNNTLIINRGQPNLGDFDMSGYITFNNDGWNLLGNPYHAHIDWDALHATTTDISGDIMFYDETIEDFATVSNGAGATIAPNQGFWVNSTGVGSLVFTENTKSLSNASTFRNQNTQLFGIRLKSAGGTRFTSGTQFRFAPDRATALKGDLPFKRLPNPMAPALCSKSAAGKDLKINLLSSAENTLTVPLKFTVGAEGLYTLQSEFVEFAELEGYSCITLVDHKTNQTHNIKAEAYQFYALTSDAENRFSLILSKDGSCDKAAGAVSMGGHVDINRIDNNTIVNLNFDEATDVTVTVTNLLGQELSPAQRVNATSQQLVMSLPADFSGIYLVNVQFNNNVVTRKLFR